MRIIKYSFVIFLCLTAITSISPVAKAEHPETKEVSVTVYLRGIHNVSDFSTTYDYDDGQYSGTLIRQNNTFETVVRSYRWATYTYRSDKRYPNDKSVNGQFNFPSTYTTQYYDSLSRQYFSAELSKSGSPYFYGNVISRTLYWVHNGYQYDPINHAKLGYMSNNNSTYYNGQCRYSDPPKQPTDYYGPSDETGLGWVQYQAPTWAGALQDSTNEPWHSICLAYHGTDRFISETGRSNRYRKPVRIYYSRSAPCQYIYQEYKGIVAVIDTRIKYMGTVTLKETDSDVEVVASTITDWYADMDVTVSATVKNNSEQPIPSVAIQLTIGSNSYTENISIPANSSNLAVFRFTLPEAGEYIVQIVADSGSILNEEDENNNTLRRNIQIKEVPPSIVIDPDDSRMEQYCETYGLSSVPQKVSSKYHTWQEVRLENGSYVTKDYWARLNTTFEILPDDRIAISEESDTMESGYGVQVSCTTTLTTNYDHPEKLIGAQMVWVCYPESGYGQLPQWQNVNDSLVIITGNTGDTNITWQLAINPYSIINSHLHYTPLWFPNGDYTAQAQAFYAWSPVGQLYEFGTDSVKISGDMYDRVATVN